eukprot:2892555-Pyramimonas_sp.AAC.1
MRAPCRSLWSSIACAPCPWALTFTAAASPTSRLKLRPAEHGASMRMTDLGGAEIPWRRSAREQAAKSRDQEGALASPPRRGDSSAPPPTAAHK